MTKQTNRDSTYRTFEYLATGERYRTTDEEGTVTVSDFTNKGHLIRTIRNYGGAEERETEYSILWNGSINGMKDPKGTVTLYTLNSLYQRTKEEKDPDSIDYNQLSDWCSDWTVSSNPQDIITEFEYNENGQLTKITAHNSTTGNQVTEYTYNNVGRRKKTTYPDGTSTENIFDSRGYVKEEVKKDETATVIQKLAFERNVFGNVVKISDADNSSTVYKTFAYNTLLGAIVSSMDYNSQSTSDDDVTVSNTFDTSTGNLLSQTRQIGTGSQREVDYSYNAVTGRLDTVMYPSLSEVNYSYNLLNLTDSISFNTSEICRYTYDYMRRINTKQIKDGGVEVVTLDIDYNEFSEITDYTWSQGGTPLLDYEYGYVSSLTTLL